MIERLILNETAYFYHKTRELSDSFITEVFKEVSRQKSGPYAIKLINEQTFVNDHEVTYSLCVYKFKEKPGFLDTEGSEIELKYAYLLIVQYSDMVVVNKKNISGLDRLLSGYVSDVDYTTISRLFLSDSAHFEKFSMSNMDINDKAVRKRNIEANDLKSSYSPIYASKYILNNMRIKDRDKRISLALNTSKINRLGKKVSFLDYLKWIVEVVERIENFELTESYLDNFSIPLNTHDVLNELTPTSILFLFNSLLEQFENGQIENIEYRYKGKIKAIDLQKYLWDFDTYCEVETTVNETTGKKRHHIKNTIDKKLILKKNRASITIGSSKLQNIVIKYSGREINLLDYLNKSQSFIVTFSNIDIVYSNKKIFKDSKLLGNLDFFLEVLEPYDALNSVTSEKGVNTSTSTSFDPNSLFHFIETHLASDADYLFCDDLGNEFADFISVRDLKSVCYYHAKYDTSQLSASDFQVVIGQALKNIGNMSLSPADLDRKKARWQGTISGTNISLKRIGDTVENGGNALMRTLNTPNSVREIYIVINFLSKSRLQEELINLKEGRSVRHQVVQLLWLLSSFISTCNELGCQVHITCKP